MCARRWPDIRWAIAQGETNGVPEKSRGFRMTEQQFQSELARAKTMQGKAAEPAEADYWIGYQRGLRRAFLGERFGTARQHEEWLSLASDADSLRAARGRGYCDGLRFGGEGWVTT
jgi:hypothetical protein